MSAAATIERVEVETLDLPLHTPFVTALRRATSVESVVVRVTDSLMNTTTIELVVGDATTGGGKVSGGGGCGCSTSGRGGSPLAAATAALALALVLARRRRTPRA